MKLFSSRRLIPSFLAVLALSCFPMPVARGELRMVKPQGTTKPLPPSAPPSAAPLGTVSPPSPSTGENYGPAAPAFGGIFSPYHSSRWQVGVELLGPGMLYSVGGSYLLTDHVALNAGVSFFSVSANAFGQANASATATTIPLSVSGLFGGPDHHFEVLGGASPILGTGELSIKSGGTDRAAGRTLMGFAGLGYRYWPDLGGFHFRATGYLMVAKGIVFPWAGFQFGYAF